MSDLQSLIETAKEGSRKIDALLWLQWGWRDVRDPNLNSVTDILAPDDVVMGVTLAEAIIRWPNDIDGVARNWNIPRLSSSMDAALSLVERKLPGWSWGITAPDNPEDDPALQRQHFSARLRKSAVIIRGHAPTAALAICLALLKAVQAQAKEPHSE